MARRRGWILFVLGLMFALIAGVLVFFVLEGQRSNAEEAARQALLQEEQVKPTIPLPVAVRKLTPGTVLTPNDYEVKNFPIDLVPVDAITQTTTIDSQVLIRSVGQGETFNKSQLLGGDGETVSQQIVKGQILMAFPIVDLLSQSNLINDGDHLDLLLTLRREQLETTEVQNPTFSQVTGITLQNIEVFRVLRPRSSDDEEQATATALLFSLKPEDAVMLKFIKDLGGTIDFTMRSPLDQDTFTVEPVKEEDLRTRFNFR